MSGKISGELRGCFKSGSGYARPRNTPSAFSALMLPKRSRSYALGAFACAALRACFSLVLASNPLSKQPLRGFLVFLAVVGGVQSHAAIESSARIRVRLSEAITVSRVRGLDLRFSRGDHSPSTISEGQTEWELQCKNGQLLATRVSGNPGKLEFSGAVEISSPSGFLRFEGRPYRDELRIRPVGSNCEVVNRVDLEKYLDGLVNSEFSSKWSEEAVAAQVVAARTYALYQIREARTRSFDVDSSVKDQVYDGSMKEDFRASRGVGRTRGWVLTLNPSGKPRPLKAFYHSTCAGETELPQEVWGRSYPGFKRKVRCAYCASSPALNWELEMSGEEIKSELLRAVERSELPKEWPRNAAKLLRSAELVGIRLGKSTGKGAGKSTQDERVSKVILRWREGGTKGAKERDWEVPAPRFRQWMGPARFRSTSFQASLLSSSSRWKFVGKGNGHGVGMCQYGAKTMGEKGFKMAEILRHYYPGATLRKLW